MGGEINVEFDYFYAKQTQFPGGTNERKPFSQGDYENKACFQTRRKQSQSNPISKSQIGFGL